MSSSKPTNRSEIQDIKSILAELERILATDDDELSVAAGKASADAQSDEAASEGEPFDSERSLRSEVALLGETPVDEEEENPFVMTGERTVQMSNTARTRALESVSKVTPEPEKAAEPDAEMLEQLDLLPESVEESSEAEAEPAETEASFLPDFDAEPLETSAESEPESEEGLDEALELLSSLPQEEETSSLPEPSPEEHEMDESALAPLDLAADLEEGSPSNLESLDEEEPQEEGSMSDQDTPKTNAPQDQEGGADEEILDLATLLEDVEGQTPDAAKTKAEPKAETVEEAPSEAPEEPLELEGPGSAGGEEILELDLALPDEGEGLLEAVHDEELADLEADVEQAQSPIASAEDLKEFESAYLDALLLNDEDFEAAMKESGVVPQEQEAAPEEAEQEVEEVAAAELEEGETVDEEVPMPDLSDIDFGDLDSPMEAPRKLDPDVDLEGRFTDDEEQELADLGDLNEDLLFPEGEEIAEPDVDGTGNFGDTLSGLSGKESSEEIEPSAPAWQAEPLAAAAETAVAGAAAAAGQAAVQPAAQVTGIDAEQLAALLAPMIEKTVRDTVLEVAERVIREEMSKLREALDEDPGA